MTMTRHDTQATPRPRKGCRVLYVGHEANEICQFVSHHLGLIDIIYESKAASAISHLRWGGFDTVIVDLRNAGEALKLLLPLVAETGPSIRLVVISSFQDVGAYLAVPGVARVLSAPIREGQFLRVLGLQETPRQARADQSRTALRASPLKALSDAGMKLVSLLYKRAAFVVLAALFAAFLFYGALILFFLLSSGWGAPMTLARGHELVSKAEREITELRVALSQIEQKLTQARADKLRAGRELAEAEVLVTYAASTVGKEIERLQRANKALDARIARTTRVQSALTRELGKSGMKDDLARLYGKRLISKKQYSSSTLGLLEAGQRLAAVESELDDLQVQQDNAAVSLLMLQSLQDGLATGGPISSVTGASSDLLLLTKQAFDARAAADNATAEIASSEEVIGELTGARQVLKRQVSALEISALGRAINERIDVVFVPYANQSRFQPGAGLWSCTWTIVWCSKAGSVGVPLPGEAAGVHPFFGKPVRGFFVEAKMSDPSAASREIIHGSRAPLFF